MNTVVSLALGIEVFALGSDNPADQWAPSLVFEPKRTGTWAKPPELKASTGRLGRKVPSNIGAKTKIVEGRVPSNWLPANVSVSLLTERKHDRSVVVSWHPLYQNKVITHVIRTHERTYAILANCVNMSSSYDSLNDGIKLREGLSPIAALKRP